MSRMIWLAQTLMCSGVLLATCPAVSMAITDDPPARDVPPSLDDLLDLRPDERDVSAEQSIADQQASEELRRRLAAEAIGDAFAQAIRLMGLVVARLGETMDTGIETQRAQDDVIARLESLIEESRRQSQSGSSCSSSASSQSRQQQQQQPGAQSSQGTSGQQSEQQAASDDGEGDGEGAPPFAEQDNLSVALEGSRSEWGALPDRVRDMLLQGRRERFSSLYEQLTREYYRRLAEE